MVFSRGSYVIFRLNCTSAVKLFVVAEDTLFVEGNSPLRGNVGSDARALDDTLVQRKGVRYFVLLPLHRVRKSVAQALDHLEE